MELTRKPRDYSPRFNHNQDFIRSRDHIKHISQPNSTPSKSISKLSKIKSVLTQPRCSSGNIDWDKKLTNHQLYLKLMEIQGSRKNHRINSLNAESQTRERMINNMEMARRRKQIDIMVQNSKMLKRIQNATIQKDLISQMFKRPAMSVSPKKRYRKHKTKKKIFIDLPNIMFVENKL